MQRLQEVRYILSTDTVMTSALKKLTPFSFCLAMKHALISNEMQTVKPTGLGLLKIPR
jgi:hypothetical protein